MIQSYPPEYAQLNKDIQEKEEMEMKIVKVERTYKVSSENQSISKVYQVCVAYDDSLVISGRIRRNKYFIRHYSKQNQLLGEIEAKDQPFSSFVMSSPTYVCAMDLQKSQIRCWDLINKKQLNIPVLLANPQCSFGKLFFFTNSGNLCLVNYGNPQNCELHLLYFQAPFKENMQSYAEFKSEEDNFTLDHHLVGKLDEEQTIYWMKSAFGKGKVSFYSFNSKDKIQKVSIDFNRLIDTIYTEPPLVNFDFMISVSAMIPLRKNVYFFSTHTNRPKKNDEPFVNNFYVVDLNEQDIRVAKFNLGKFKYHLLNSDGTRFGDCIMIQTHSFSNEEKLCQSPAFFISSKWEHVLDSQVLAPTKARKWFTCSHNENILIEALYPNGDVSQIKIIQRVAINPYMAPKILKEYLTSELPEKVQAFLLEYELNKILEIKQQQQESNEEKMQKEKKNKSNFFTCQEIANEKKKYNQLASMEILSQMLSNLCENRYFNEKWL